MLLTQGATTPSECVFGVAIPVTRDEFERDLVSPSKDFVPKRCRSWLRYQALVVQHYEWAAPRIKAVGVQLRHSFALADFAAATHSSARVVTLFSHWTGEEVEFADRLRRPTDVAAAVSPTFGGILDLTVCNSTELGHALRERCPAALVKMGDDEAAPEFWLLAYRLAYAYLLEKPIDFLSALTYAVRNLYPERTIDV